MAVTWDLDIEDVAFPCPLRRRSLDLVRSLRLKSQIAKMKLNAAVNRVIFQVETVDDRRRLDGMDMDVDHLIESVKCSRLEEGLEAPVCRHSFLLGPLHSRVRVRSSDPKM